MLQATFNPSHQFDVEEQRFLRCLESLRRWSGINAGHQNEKRGAERLDFYGNPVVVAEVPPAEEGEAPKKISFRVWGRDLSRGGMSFLIGREVMPVLLTDSAPLLRVDDLLSRAEEVTVGLGKPDNTMLWVIGHVLRIRPVHESLLECGVEFVRRVED